MNENTEKLEKCEIFPEPEELVKTHPRLFINFPIDINSLKSCGAVINLSHTLVNSVAGNIVGDGSLDEKEKETKRMDCLEQMRRTATHHPNFIVCKLAYVLDDQTSVRLRLNELVALLCHLALDDLPVKSLLIELLIQSKGSRRFREGGNCRDRDVVVLISADVQHWVTCIGKFSLYKADA